MVTFDLFCVDDKGDVTDESRGEVDMDVLLCWARDDRGLSS